MQSALNSGQRREGTVYVLAVIISHGIILISSKAKEFALHVYVCK